MTICSLDVLLSQFGTSLLFMSGSNCCFLIWIQVSQEAGRAGKIWSGIPVSFRIFQFVVIYTIKGFSVVNGAEVDVFLEFSCFFYDPMDVAK